MFHITAAISTTKAILRFSSDGEAYLHSYHPGATVEDILANTGWALVVSPKVCETPVPMKRELRVIRSYDPEHFWTK